MQIKMLVVDDDAVLCEFVRDVLASEKIDAHTLSDSREACGLLRSERFDAVFLDMNMPQMNGLELATEIRRDGVNRTTPIVMITGEKDHRATNRAFQAGINLFLFKPVDRLRLMRVVHAADNFIRREKLKYLRVKARHGASIDFGDRRVAGTTLDVSMGGMSVRAPASLPVGSVVTVGLELHPGAPPIRVAARVVRIFDEDCMGLQIDSTAVQETRAFREFIEPLVLRQM